MTIDVRELRAHIGEELGVSDWLEITQARVDQFADATGDHQWIHVDPVRALTQSPYKTTIAHGFLTLSLISSLLRDSIAFTGLRMAINYGSNRVRFASPVPTGSRIRGRFTLASIEDVADGIQAAWQVTVEREGSPKPCLVAEWLVRYYPAPIN
ncbi:MAG TPA: MaoC family dehydratase [Vicinamibacterales bacterium]|nr:MaoC family dehydratase [Vicinamibacterales bacterium]